MHGTMNLKFAIRNSANAPPKKPLNLIQTDRQNKSYGLIFVQVVDNRNSTSRHVFQIAQFLI